MKEEDILEEIQVYEIGFHILATVSEEKLQETVLSLENLITQNGGSVISEEFPKIRPLAYDIRKKIETKYVNFNKAYFGWIKFEAIPTLVIKIDNGMMKNKDILRFLIIKTVKENTMYIPKIPMFKKGSDNKEERSIPTVEKPSIKKVKASKEDIDKSIDELIIKN